MAFISVLLLHVEPSLLSWGHQPFLVLYSCSQGFLLHGKSALSSDWVVRGKKEKNWQNQVKYQINTCVYEKHGNSYPYCPGIWRCGALRYWPGRRLVYVCPLLLVCVTEMGYFRVTLLKAVSKRSAKLLRWLDPVILWGYHPTLKFSGIPTFTLIISLTYSMDKILISL